MKDHHLFWQRVAKLYTPLQEKSNQALYNEVSILIKPHLTSSMKVLELACGTGQFSFPLSPYVKKWVATDYSDHMIQEAKKRNHTAIVFEVADTTALQYKTNKFDACLIANALHIMPDPKQALKEIKRILKPNGLIIAPTFVYDGTINHKRLWLLEKVGFHTYSKWTFASYQQMLQNAGFQIIDAQFIQGDLLPEALVIASNIK